MEVALARTRPVRRVFVVDDHDVFRLGLQHLLADEPTLDMVGGAASSEEAIERLAEIDVDLVIVDIRLGTTSGLELIRHVKRARPDVTVLVLSMHDEALFAERSLRAGADGYLTKDTDPARLIEGVERVLRGEVVVGPRTRERLGRPPSDEGAHRIRSPIQTLTDRELEVFELIGRGYRTRVIAEKLSISRKTVETHHTHIKRKLGLDGVNELVRAAVVWVADLDGYRGGS